MTLVQSAIKDGKPWKETTNNSKKPIKAILIDVQEEHMTQEKLIFSKLYGSSVKSFPLQTRHCYIPCIEPDTPSQLRAQIQKLSFRQQWFQESINHAQT